MLFTKYSLVDTQHYLLNKVYKLPAYVNGCACSSVGGVLCSGGNLFRLPENRGGANSRLEPKNLNCIALTTPPKSGKKKKTSKKTRRLLRNNMSQLNYIMNLCSCSTQCLLLDLLLRNVRVHHQENFPNLECKKNKRTHQDNQSAL